MNQKQLIQTRQNNLKLLDTLARPKLNAVEVDINNNIEHETTKFLCVYMIRKGVPATTLPKYFQNMSKYKVREFIDCFGEKFKEEWRRPVIITEARFKKFSGKTRRADIFILDTGEKVEIETGVSYIKEDCVTVMI